MEDVETTWTIKHMDDLVRGTDHQISSAFKPYSGKGKEGIEACPQQTFRNSSHASFLLPTSFVDLAITGVKCPFGSRPQF